MSLEDGSPALIVGTVGLLTAAGAVIVKVIGATRKNGSGNGNGNYGPEIVALYRSVEASMKGIDRTLQELANAVDQLREENLNFHREGRAFMAGAGLDRARLMGIAEGIREAERRQHSHGGEQGL